MAAAFGFGVFTLIAFCLAAPWIEPRLILCGWLGVAALLHRATRKSAFRYVGILYAVTLAIVIAFHWAPAALANQMHRGYGVGLLVFLPLVAVDAMRAALPFWLAARMANRPAMAWLLAGLCAVASEALVPGVFPWRYGYMQIAWPWSLQAADVFGSGWTSFMLFVHAGVLLWIWELLKQRLLHVRNMSQMRWPAVLAVVVWVLNSLYGIFAMQHWKAVAADAPALRIGLVQVEPGYVQTAPRLRELSEQIVDRVDLVCWPESSAGCYATELTSFADKQQVVLQSREPDRGLQPWPDARCALLTGASLYRGNGETPEALYQAAILIDPNQQIVDSYTKRFLMPFGEFMPLEDWFPGLQELFPRDEAISRGSVANPLRFGERARLGVMLCYEDMMPLAARSLCQGSANLLVSLINASDFEATLARSQHRLLAQMRAIECRRYLVRCAATGETCVISPWGTIEERLPLEGEGALTAKVRLIDRPSVYSQRGEFLPWLCGTALLVYLISVRLVGAGQAKTLRTDG